MASSSVDFLSYKPHVAPASSTNHKADIINQYLQEHKILLQIVARHPNVLDEYVNAVKKGELPAHPADRTATNPRATDLIINIGLATMAKYPEILNEYVSAVKGEITQ